jgi:hypothetical protein
MMPMFTQRYVINPIVAFIVAAGMVIFVEPLILTQAISTTLVISQFQVSGNGVSDEFVEIHNISGHSINLNGYKLVYRVSDGTSDYLLNTFGSVTLPAGGYYLAAGGGYDDESVLQDTSFSTGLAAAGGGIAIRNTEDVIIDSVGYGSANNSFIEGTRTTNPPANQSQARLANGCMDTDNNLNDYAVTNPSNPRNSLSLAVLCVPQDITPAVTSTTPADGAIDVLTSSNIIVEFTETVVIDQETFFSIVCDLIAQEGEVSGSDTTYTIDPDEDLPGNTTCSVIIFATAVVDQDGIPDYMTDDYEFSFSVMPVDDAPTVISTTPDSGAVKVDINSGMMITFSEPVALSAGFAAITCDKSGAHTYQIDEEDDPSIVLMPDASFDRGDACTVTIDAGKVTDKDWEATPMDSGYSWSFTTLQPDSPPEVLGVSPVDNASDVWLTTNLTVSFSEPVITEDGWYMVSCNRSGYHTGDVTGNDAGSSFIIDPGVDFYFSDTCTVTIEYEKVFDQDSDDPPDTMLSNFIWSFTVIEPAYAIFCSLILMTP